MQKTFQTHRQFKKKMEKKYCVLMKIDEQQSSLPKFQFVFNPLQNNNLIPIQTEVEIKIISLIEQKLSLSTQNDQRVQSLWSLISINCFSVILRPIKLCSSILYFQQFCVNKNIIDMSLHFERTISRVSQAL